MLNSVKHTGHTLLTIILGITSFIAGLVGIYAKGSAPAATVIKYGGYSNTPYDTATKVLGVVAVLIAIYALVLVIRNFKMNKVIFSIPMIVLLLICIVMGVFAEAVGIF